MDSHRTPSAARLNGRGRAPVSWQTLPPLHAKRLTPFSPSMSRPPWSPAHPPPFAKPANAAPRSQPIFLIQFLCQSSYCSLIIYRWCRPLCKSQRYCTVAHESGLQGVELAFVSDTVFNCKHRLREGQASLFIKL